MSTLNELQTAIDATPPFGLLKAYMRAGTVIDLEGRAIFINQINCQLASDGAGALLNAQHRSRLFEVLRGANFSLYSVTLSNGQAAPLTSGGSIRIVGAHLTLSHSSAIVNSTSGEGGGAIVMQAASVVLTAGSYISNSTCQLQGGAVKVSSHIGQLFFDGRKLAQPFIWRSWRCHISRLFRYAQDSAQ